MIDFEALSAPFEPSKVDWRVGSTNREKTKGMALAYIDARAVQDRLDDVAGQANWQCRYPHVGGKTACEIGIRVEDEWVWKSDGAGDTDFEADKGAFSDAFKRAAVRWGIGRYLYDMAAPWVDIEQFGNSYRIRGDQLELLYKKMQGQQVNLHKKVAHDSPGKFWQGDVLTIRAPQKYLEEGMRDNMLEWVFEKLLNGIERAPTYEKLEKFVKDNDQWINQLDVMVIQKVNESHAIRRAEFQGGK